MDTSNDIEVLINEIIPPDDYQHRNGFSNDHLINALNDKDKAKVEAQLIVMLQKKTDMLIVETLGDMKSENALPVLYELLNFAEDEMVKIIIATSIFKINQDQNIIEVGKISFKNLKKKYQLIPAFYYMVIFRDIEVSKLIEGYIKNPDELISFNAKQALSRYKIS